MMDAKEWGNCAPMTMTAPDDVPASLRVLNVTYHADIQYGGLVRSVPGLCLATNSIRGVESEILAMAGKDERSFDHAFVQLKGKVLRERGPRGFSDLLAFGTFARVVSRFDLVMVHGIWAPNSIAVSLASRLARRPYIANVHGSLSKWALGSKTIRKRLYWWAAESRTINRAACVRALTTTEAEDYRRAGVNRPICVIPNGVDIDLDADPSLFFSQYPELQGHRIVVFLGRLVLNKGVDLLCEAWKAVYARHKDARLVIAGPNANGTEAQLRRRVAELGISGSVHFPGPVYGASKASLLQAAELFVLPSRSEGFSMAILEAMAAGLAIIITRECNFNDVAQTGGGAIIERTASALSEALDRMLAQSTAAVRHLGQKNRERARAVYSWQIVARQAIEMYQWVLGGSRPSSFPIL
jgi:glycosyltransferase involved in cell wall biosynthesis